MRGHWIIAVELAGDAYFTNMRGFLYVLVVIHGGEEGRLVPGKPEEVTPTAVITVVCSLRSLAQRLKFKSSGACGVGLHLGGSERCCWIWMRGISFGSGWG